MHPHNHLFPGFYYIAQAFDYLHQCDDSDGTISHIDTTLYASTGTERTVLENDTNSSENAPLSASPPRSDTLS